MWNPFRSKLAAAILGGVDKIHIKPGSKVLYLGAASGTTVSHVADIVGPVSALMCENVAMKLQPSHLLSPCVCKECCNPNFPSYLILQFISVSNSLHSPHYHFIPSPLTPSPLTPSPLTPSPLTPSPFTPSLLTNHHSPSSHQHFTPSSFTHQHSTISPNHSSPSTHSLTHSLTGGSGVCCGILSPLREGPDQRSQEENQHHSHHRGRQTPAQVQDAGR